MHFSTLLSGAALFQLSIAGYVLEDDYMKDFYGSFDFFTAPDPTEGFVQYIDQETAEQTGLINATTTSQVSWGVDHTNVTPEGRPSIRISSKKSYNTGLVVLDVDHMPTGCGTWPAFWMLGPQWPDNGEIDILEGVNDQEHNAMTLHTGPNCAISEGSVGAFTGQMETANCDVDAPDQLKNAGCSIKHPSKKSYGAGLNANKGGVYATHWTEQAISIYFFPRGEIPEDVLGDSPDPASWGKPAAKFSGACDIASSFTDQRIVFDTTFCGVWAGNVWEAGSCAKKAATCEEYVRDNPEAFADAFWTINALKVYTDNGEEPATSQTAEFLPSSTATEVSSAVPSESPSETPSETAIATSSTADSSSDAPISTPEGSSDASSLPPPDPTLAPPASTGIAAFPTVDLTSLLSDIASTPSSNPSSAPTNPESSIAISTSESPSPPPSSTQAAASSTQDAPSSANPTPAPAPTNDTPKGPMSAFQWPVGGGGGQPNDEEPPKETTASPAQPTASPSPALPSPSIPTPSPSPPAAEPTDAPSTPPSSQAPEAPAPTPTSSPLAIPLPSDAKTVETVFETVFITAGAAAAPTAAALPSNADAGEVKTVYETVVVTAEVPAATPSPALRKARQARQMRRRVVKHNVGR